MFFLINKKTFSLCIFVYVFTKMPHSGILQFPSSRYIGDRTFWSEKESSPLPAPRTAAVGGDARADGEEPLLLLAVTILRSGFTASDSSIRPRGAAPATSAATKYNGKTRRTQKHLNRRLSSKRQGREASRWGVNGYLVYSACTAVHFTAYI